MIIDYVSRVLTRAQLNSAAFAFTQGEQLVAIVPYSTTDDVTLITMKRRPDVQVVTSAEDIKDAESRLN